MAVGDKMFSNGDGGSAQQKISAEHPDQHYVELGPFYDLVFDFIFITSV